MVVMNETNKENKVKSRQFVNKLERKETLMTNGELMDLFSRSKAFKDMVVELNKVGLFCNDEKENTLVSNTDWLTSWHTDKNESFEFMTHYASFDFTHKDGHNIWVQVALRSNFKLKSKGQYDNDDVENAKRLIEESYDYNSKSLKATFNGGSVFISSPMYHNGELVSKGHTDDIEGGFATVVKCATSEDYAMKKLGLGFENLV